MSSISEVVHHVGLGHADARVADRERVVRLVRDELDLHLLLVLELRVVRERLELDLVERVARVRDELAKEHVLVGVERVDDQRQKLVDVRREGERFRVFSHDVL